MKNLSSMLKEAQKLQQRMTEMQQRLEEIEVSGAAGGGMITVTLSGKGQMRKIKIDPALVVPGEVEMLEDLIVAATNDAKAKLESQMQDEMGKLTGGLPLPPGFKLPF
jgi:DNA-binding YbaB/EbfC family protein